MGYVAVCRGKEIQGQVYKYLKCAILFHICKSSLLKNNFAGTLQFKEKWQPTKSIKSAIVSAVTRIYAW